MAVQGGERLVPRVRMPESKPEAPITSPIAYIAENPIKCGGEYLCLFLRRGWRLGSLARSLTRADAVGLWGASLVGTGIYVSKRPWSVANKVWRARGGLRVFWLRELLSKGRVVGWQRVIARCRAPPPAARACLLFCCHGCLFFCAVLRFDSSCGVLPSRAPPSSRADDPRAHGGPRRDDCGPRYCGGCGRHHVYGGDGQARVSRWHPSPAAAGVSAPLCARAVLLLVWQQQRRRGAHAGACRP
jgi:hypothetical protein